jgi:hypothetical protein
MKNFMMFLLVIVMVLSTVNAFAGNKEVMKDLQENLQFGDFEAATKQIDCMSTWDSVFVLMGLDSGTAACMFSSNKDCVAQSIASGDNFISSIKDTSQWNYKFKGDKVYDTLHEYSFKIVKGKIVQVIM